MTTAIDGTWEIVRAELDGEVAPEVIVARTIVAFAHGAYQVSFDGETSDRGSFELSSTPQLQTLVLHGREGQNAGRTIPCIYQHKGDRLRVCYGLSGVTPTEFSTAPGQQRYLVIYRRAAD